MTYNDVTVSLCLGRASGELSNLCFVDCLLPSVAAEAAETKQLRSAVLRSSKSSNRFLAFPHSNPFCCPLHLFPHLRFRHFAAHKRRRRREDLMPSNVDSTCTRSATVALRDDDAARVQRQADCSCDAGTCAPVAGTRRTAGCEPVPSTSRPPARPPARRRGTSPQHCHRLRRVHSTSTRRPAVARHLHGEIRLTRPVTSYIERRWTPALGGRSTRPYRDEHCLELYSYTSLHAAFWPLF